MFLKTLDGFGNVIFWEKITAEKWDKLGELSRAILSYTTNGIIKWVFVKRV